MKNSSENLIQFLISVDKMHIWIELKNIQLLTGEAF